MRETHMQNPSCGSEQHLRNQLQHTRCLFKERKGSNYHPTWTGIPRSQASRSLLELSPSCLADTPRNLTLGASLVQVWNGRCLCVGGFAYSILYIGGGKGTRE